MEPLTFGEEPDWVQEQRQKDFEACSIQRKDPWTQAEDERLQMLLKQHRYSYKELSEMLRRSEGAILRRCLTLGLNERPVKAKNVGKDIAWTDEQYQMIADGIRSGDSYAQIARRIGKSEKAVRGKSYVAYRTENADKIRAMLGDGAWGDGAPPPTVKQALYLSEYKHEVQHSLSELVGVLNYRIRTLDDNPYWQRYMCMNWDDTKCKTGCTDCDSCTQFQRIRPQYCARCGSTFYERKENRFCPACRKARLKQAQRKWCRQQKGDGL